MGLGDRRAVRDRPDVPPLGKLCFLPRVGGIVVLSLEVNMKWALALALAISVPSTFAADVVNGNFHFGKTKFKPADAIAYQLPGKDNKPVTIVVFADFKIDR